MGVKLSTGDLIVTKQYNGEKVEVCQYAGQTGYLMYTLKCPPLMMRIDIERFIRDTDSLPYSQTIIRSGTELHTLKMKELQC